MKERGRSSDSGLPPPPPSRLASQWHVGGRASPLTAAGPSRTSTGFPHRALLWRASLSSDRAADQPPSPSISTVRSGTRGRSGATGSPPPPRPAAGFRRSFRPIAVMRQRHSTPRAGTGASSSSASPRSARPCTCGPMPTRAQRSAGSTRRGRASGVFTDAPDRAGARRARTARRDPAGAARRDGHGRARPARRELGDGTVVVHARDELVAASE